MRFKPVFAPTGICYQWHIERVCVLHLFEHNLLHLLFLFRIDAEVQFIVYLKYHFGTDVLASETFEDVYHRHFDDVGGTALDRHADRLGARPAACTGLDTLRRQPGACGRSGSGGLDDRSGRGRRRPVAGQRGAGLAGRTRAGPGAAATAGAGHAARAGEPARTPARASRGAAARGCPHKLGPR